MNDKTDKMKYAKDIDLKIGIGISFLGVVLTCYLWTFVNGGNHWQLFGTNFEKLLMKYDTILVLFFSSCLVFPLLFKRDKKRLITALFAILVFIFLLCSLIIFSD